MCCIVCVLKGVTSTRTEEAKYGTCLTPLGRFQKLGGLVVEGMLAPAESMLGRCKEQELAISSEYGCWRLKWGKKGVSLSPRVEYAFPQDQRDLWPVSLNCLGCCPLGWPSVEYRSEVAGLFCRAGYRINVLKGLGWGVDGVLSAVPWQILCYLVMMWGVTWGEAGCSVFSALSPGAQGLVLVIHEGYSCAVCLTFSGSSVYTPLFIFRPSWGFNAKVFWKTGVYCSDWPLLVTKEG